MHKIEKEIREQFLYLSYAPIVFVSAKTKQRLVNLYKLSKEVYTEASKRISTSILNKVVLDAVSRNPPQTIRGKRLKLFYTTQVKTNPPTIVLFINNEDFAGNADLCQILKNFSESVQFFQDRCVGDDRLQHFRKVFKAHGVIKTGALKINALIVFTEGMNEIGHQRGFPGSAPSVYRHGFICIVLCKFPQQYLFFFAKIQHESPTVPSAANYR